MVVVTFGTARVIEVTAYDDTNLNENYKSLTISFRNIVTHCVITYINNDIRYGWDNLLEKV